MARRKSLPINKVSRELYNQWVAHKIDLLRVEESHIEHVYGMLNDVQIDIRKRLERDYKVYQITNKRQLSELRQARLAKIHDNVGEAINDYRKKITKWHQGELIELINAELDFSADAFNSSIGAEILTVTPTMPQIRAMAGDLLIHGAPSKDWWQGQARDIQDRFMRVVRTGMYEGEGMDAISRRLFDEPSIVNMLERSRNVSEGTPLMRTMKRNASALVRTSVQTASAAARDELYGENSDLFNGYEYIATLDGRTTQQCMGLDGLQWDAEYNGIGHNIAFLRPPNDTHWNCRSWIEPLVKTWEELAGVKTVGTDNKTVQEKFEANLRARGLPEEEVKGALMDARASSAPDYKGLVADKSYNKWLQNRPESFQRKMLGASRYDLFKSGKLNLHEMIDQKGRPLTVKELYQKIEREKRQKIPSL